MSDQVGISLEPSLVVHHGDNPNDIGHQGAPEGHARVDGVRLEADDNFGFSQQRKASPRHQIVAEVTMNLASFLLRKYA